MRRSEWIVDSRFHVALHLIFLGISLAAGAAIYWLLQNARAGEDKAPKSLPRLGLEIVLLAIFCRLGLGWLNVQGTLAPGKFPYPLKSPDVLWSAAFLSLFGGAVFLNLAHGQKRWRLFLSGLVLGLAFSILGASAYGWISVAVAWKLLGWFRGSFAWVALPFALGGSFVLAASLCLSEEARPIRFAGLAVLVLSWSLPARAFLWRLKSSWGYGPRTLAEAAQIPEASRAQRVNIVWLRPAGQRPYRFEYLRPMAEDGVGVDVPDLWRLYDYLRRHRYSSIFAKQALDALRRGWLDWWDADMALKAASLSYPNRAAPDYLGALALVRAGALDQSRYEDLRELDDLAAARREGFEDVTPSQHIYEAFEKAYARFGDEANAGYWLAQVDNLWPIYEDKVEADPVQGFQTGEVKGSVFIDGRAAKPILVGLFCLAVSTNEPQNVRGTLSQSAFPDGGGRFHFKNLGAGFYYLGLMGNPLYLRGQIENSPGVFSLSESTPAAVLDPILIERAMTPSEPEKLSPSYLHFLNGLLYFQNGNRKKAESEWEKSEALDPRAREPRAALKFLKRKAERKKSSPRRRRLRKPRTKKTP